MIGHFQEPLDGSVEREDHEIVAARHEIGRDKDMVDQRLKGRLDAGDLLVRRHPARRARSGRRRSARSPEAKVALSQRRFSRYRSWDTGRVRRLLRRSRAHPSAGGLHRVAGLRRTRQRKRRDRQQTCRNALPAVTSRQAGHRPRPNRSCIRLQTCQGLSAAGVAGPPHNRHSPPEATEMKLFLPLE